MIAPPVAGSHRATKIVENIEYGLPFFYFGFPTIGTLGPTPRMKAAFGKRQRQMDKLHAPIGKAQPIFPILRTPEIFIKKTFDLLGFKDYRLEVKPAEKRAALFIYEDQNLVRENSS